MFSFELELYAIPSLFDIFGPNTNHSVSKHLVCKSSYSIIDVNDWRGTYMNRQFTTYRILHYM